jgi:signal transduction histidine kinase
MKENDILFEIQDFGKGIPKNKQKKIFNTFYQVDSGMDRKFGGAGLGLAISRGIVLSHGGIIYVESNLGEGSIFCFTLPINPVKDLENRFKEIDIFGLENNKKNTG